MKTLSLLFLVVLFSCKKEINSGNPKREEIAITQNKTIAPTDYIVSTVVNRDSIISTYQSGLILVEVTNPRDPYTSTLIYKYQKKSFLAYKRITVTAYGWHYEVLPAPGTSKTIPVYFDFITDANHTLIGEERVLTPMPLHILFGGDDYTYYQCMQRQVNLCKQHFSCSLFCGIALMACINGNSIMCFALTRR